MTIAIAFTQHCGNNLSQQDALWDGMQVFQERDLVPRLHTTNSPAPIVIAVADGVASSPYPQKASKQVLKSLAAELVTEAPFDGRMIRRIHGYLCDTLAKGKTFSALTTLIAAQYHRDRCSILSIGDSRAYRMTAKGDWQQLSRDHTVLNAMIDRGEAVAGKVYASIYNMLDACLVADDEETEFPLHRAESSLLPGESLLLCTDGVHDVLGDAKLQRLMNPQLDAQAQVTILRKAILAAGAPDNFSMVLLRCG